MAIGTKALGSYGWGLFAAIPFAQGALAALLTGVHRRPSLGSCVLVALLSVALAAAALLAIALEGAVCIAMATPIAGAFAVLGAAFGYAVLASPTRRHGSVASIVVCLLVVPFIMGVENSVRHAAPLYRVESSVIVNAPPAVVWPSVIAFPRLPPPTELVFRLGIADPEGARIVRAGAGAIRYCDFSTGSFVEPITVWKPGRLLAFNVVQSAEPMRELSPYGRIETPHLHEYMLSRRGEFLLEPLPGNRTRLVGITWYQHHLWPATYWAVFSDAIIHTIHLRVLNHVKALAERRG